MLKHLLLASYEHAHIMIATSRKNNFLPTSCDHTHIMIVTFRK
jgi:hypothetical protein